VLAIIVVGLVLIVFGSLCGCSDASTQAPTLPGASMPRTVVERCRNNGTSPTAKTGASEQALDAGCAAQRL
jgi:hypothetical protein